MAGSLLVYLLLASLHEVNANVPPDISDPSWPGGAFPPLPWTSWSLQESLAGFFLGNTSGPNGDEETAREASLGVVGIGWQLGVRESSESWAAPGGLEKRQREAARRLKASRPGVRVMVAS